jgi:gamma-tubulin complex component 4
METQFH